VRPEVGPDPLHDDLTTTAETIMRQPGQRRWQCKTCSDIYDEALGLPEYGIAPGTRFEDLPDDWVCPMCGTPKSDFSMIDE
jgi:rubredoxin